MRVIKLPLILLLMKMILIFAVEEEQSNCLPVWTDLKMESASTKFTTFKR
jgi:hypothetical protein